MEQKLTQQMRQTKRMTQSLSQSIQLLQLSGIELMEYVKEVMEENPLIESIEPPFDYATPPAGQGNNESIVDGNLEFAKAQDATMYDQLKEQVAMSQIDESIRQLVLYGIDNLDENGYLTISLEDWATICHATKAQTEEALSIIQSLEPLGVGARDLKECLAIQVAQDKTYGAILLAIIHDHLEWIATEEFDMIMDTYQLDSPSAQEVVQRIKNCHPRPGQLLATETAAQIIPDAEIRKEANEWRIIINKWNYPTIHVNDVYHQLKNHDTDTKQFLKEKYQQVQWLTYSINYRKLQLEEVLRLLLEQQYSFFEDGPFYLKPLKLNDLATKLQVHVSTVSRMFKNKYLQTPHGVFPFRFFLQTGLAASNEKSVSAYVIKQLVQQLISQESKVAPLSDERIRHILLSEHAITISRRTIAKYRNALQIPGSTIRKVRK